MADRLNLTDIAKHFSDEDKARELIERLRWPDGAVCPHCDAIGAYKIEAKATSKFGTRKGVWKCATCRKQFSVTVGTIFEASRIPLNKWLLAIHLLCSSKKGMSAHQLHRMLGITYKSASFLAHRIRYAMTGDALFSKLSGTVEVDETYVGGKAKNMHRVDRERRIQGRGAVDNAPVVTLVERGGRVKSHHMEHVSGKNLKQAMTEIAKLGS